VRPGTASGPLAELRAYQAELIEAGADADRLANVAWWIELATAGVEDDGPEVAELAAVFGREDRDGWLARRKTLSAEL
jgi:hypothetical protein